MAKDDIFRLMYAILKELYENMKDGVMTPRENISAERFNINESYWIDIIENMIEAGFVKGVTVRQTKSGRVIGGIDDIAITIKGVEYLQENSMMKKIATALKDAKDIIPGI